MKKQSFAFTQAEENLFSYMDYQNQGEDNSEHIYSLQKKVRLVIENELSQPEQTAILLYYKEGYTIPKIAGLLSVNKSTVSRNLSRARQKVERYLRYAV